METKLLRDGTYPMDNLLTRQFSVDTSGSPGDDAQPMPAKLKTKAMRSPSLPSSFPESRSAQNAENVFESDDEKEGEK